MTRKVYEENVYKKEHKAKLLQVIEGNDKALILDETIFFPVGGGQTADQGTINGIPVKDVKEMDGRIYHYVDELPESEDLDLKIDWHRRFDQMQQHCGEHILSGVIKRLYDGNNKGFHLGEAFVTIDVDLKEITKEMLDCIEDEANQAIYENIALEFSTLDKAEDVMAFPVRKALSVNEDIRVVNIPGVDCVACCGTHPSRTGEVGIIKIYKAEKNKKMTRLYFKCGQRALKDLRTKTDIVLKLHQEYSTDDDTLMTRFYQDKLQQENLKKSYIKLNRQVIDQIVEDHLQDSEGVVDIVFEDLSSKDMNYVIKKISEAKEAIILLYSKSDQKVMLSHGGQTDLDCGKLFKVIREYAGKGGGNKKVAQGVFETNEMGLDFYAYLKDNI